MENEIPLIKNEVWKLAYQKGYEAGLKDGRAEREKKGKWVERKDVYPHKPDGEITSWGYRCSLCNQLSQLKYNFCFNCGADMRV